MIFDILIGALVGMFSLVIQIFMTIATTLISFVAGSREGAVAFVALFVVFLLGLGWFAFSSGITVEQAMLGNLTASVFNMDDYTEGSIGEYLNDTELARVSYLGGGMLDDSVILWTHTFEPMTDEEFFTWKTGYDKECYTSALARGYPDYVWEEDRQEDALMGFLGNTLNDLFERTHVHRVTSRCGVLNVTETVNLTGSTILAKREELEDYDANGSLCVDAQPIAALPWSVAFASMSDCYMIRNTNTNERIYYDNPSLIEGVLDPSGTAFRSAGQTTGEQIISTNKFRTEINSYGPLTPVMEFWFSTKESVHNNIGDKGIRNYLLDAMGFAEVFAEAIALIIIGLLAITAILIVGSFAKK